MKQVCWSLLMFGFLGWGQQAWTDRNRIYPDKLKQLPVALTLYHTPNPDHPEPSDSDGVAYEWVHETCITPLRSDLQIVEVGSFIWTKANGWIQNMELGKREFKKRFGATASKLIKGKTYCYPKNTRLGNELFAGDALWYVLAEDQEGQRYKGVGIIETEATLKIDEP
ncbi:hypothetical protein ABV409_12960 [Flagellimonas sp. DF-77]|uniref:hypothetical protein n=1 Tax=Flagellimonas algarum TaxID=3230298 RepID=UPI003399170B